MPPLSFPPNISESPDLNRCPLRSINAILESTGNKRDDFSVVTVPNKLGSLYDAVLTYADKYNHSRGDECGSIVMESFTSDSGRDDDDDDNNTDEDNRPIHQMEPVPPTDNGSGVDEGQGMGNRKRDIYGRLIVPEPMCKFGYGHSAIEWPPPPNVTATHLRQEEEKKMRIESGKSNVNDSNDAKMSTNKSDMATESAGHNTVERKKVYVVHYSIGEPRKKNCTLDRYNEVALLALGSCETLRRFTCEVLHWDMERKVQKRDMSKTRFSLYRYRNEGHQGYWNDDGLKRARLSSSIILPSGQLDMIVDDIANFLKPETKQWYISHGIPQRRCLLFYGQPGTGKTSTIRMLASRFGRACCFLNVSGASFSNQMLADAFAEMPKNALLVIEDIDVLFVRRTKKRGDTLTFSGLLNALDGVLASDDVITIMTTNRVEKLDEALIRGGRVDRRFYFGPPDDEQLESLFKSFYPGAQERVIEQFVKTVNEREGKVKGVNVKSIATLQELFIEHREHSAEVCVEDMPAFFERFELASTPKEETQKKKKNRGAGRSGKKRKKGIKKNETDEDGDEELEEGADKNGDGDDDGTDDEDDDEDDDDDADVMST